MQLVIAEKPSVARNIAKVLHATNVKDGYLEGKEYLVSWCIGHLIELASADQYRDDWKAWKYETLPMIPENWKYQIKESTKGQFRVLKELLHRADITEVICATDAGREGELIFRLVYNQAECKLPFKRLWISSMEEKAILEGFQQLKDGHEYDDLYYSAVARSEADWLVGINATRLFTVLYHHRLIVGRVQTPTLAMLVEREKSIENFQKEKYYLVHLLMDGLDAVSSRIKEKSAAVQMMEDMKDETAQILSVKKEKKKVQPPKLYDLTTLQREANRLLGFTAQQTLDYTQSLYEKKLVTYPRTDSQYLTDDMEENALLVVGAVNSMFPEMSIKGSEPDIKRLLNSKKVSDHHAIIPTVEITNMDLKALPETNCQGLFNQIHKKSTKRCQKHRMAPDTSFDRLHFSVQQVFAEIRIVWQLVDIWLPAPLDFGQFQRVGFFQCMIVARHIQNIHSNIIQTLAAEIGG